MPRTKRQKTRTSKKRPVLYQLCRAGERFEVGDGPLDLTAKDEVVLGRGDPYRTRHSKYFVDDPWMSSRHAALRKAPPGSPAPFLIEDLGSTNGVMLNGHLVDTAALSSGDLVETGRTFWLFLEEPADIPLPTEPMEFGTWATWCPQLARDLAVLEDAAETEQNILLGGAEGSGKGFLARTTHLLSARSGRLVHLDCRERRPSRLVVDLFGGRKKDSARFLEADGGTLFLENVDALTDELQDRIVDTLEEGGFVPEGRKSKKACDVRLIASTTKPLARLGRKGILSARFLDAVGQVQIEMPNIDARRTDFGLLLDDFLARARGAPAISRDATRAVLLYPWQQNIKALARVIESAAVLASNPAPDGTRGGKVELAHLPIKVVGRDVIMEQWADDTQDKGTVPAREERPVDLAAPPLANPFDGEDETTGSASPFAPDLLMSHDLDDDATNVAPHPAAHSSDVFTREKRDISDIGFSELARGFEEGDPLEKPRPPTRPGSGVRPLGDAPPPPNWDPIRPPSFNPGAPPVGERPPSAFHDMENIERSYASAVDPDLIVDALRRSRGNVSAAARYLGKPRALLLRWIREFQLEPEDYRTG